MNNIEKALDFSSIVEAAQKNPDGAKILLLGLVIYGTIEVSKVITEFGYEFLLEKGDIKIHFGKPIMNASAKF